MHARCCCFAAPRCFAALFASLLVFNGVQKPAELWGAFRADMCEDLLHTARALNPARACDLGIQHQALRDIDLHIQQLSGGSKSLSDWPDMPTYERVAAQGIVAEERGRYVPEVQAAARDVHVAQLNEQQRGVYDAVMEAVAPVMPSLSRASSSLRAALLPSLSTAWAALARRFCTRRCCMACALRAR